MAAFMCQKREVPAEYSDPSFDLVTINLRIKRPSEPYRLSGLCQCNRLIVYPAYTIIELLAGFPPGVKELFLLLDISQCLDTSLRKSLLISFSDTGERFDGHILDEVIYFIRRHKFDSIRLCFIGCQFCNPFGFGNTYGDGEFEFLVYLLFEIGCKVQDILIFDPPCDITKEFIDTELLDRGDLFFEQQFELVREFVVEGIVPEE